ncbi:MAG: HAD family phosphatase [Lawsonibacter sp.]|nr:HAD family phosphatase [Lawsonibacter sp.]
MELKFAIFDMDGTLVDSLPYWRQLYLEYLASRGVTDPPASVMTQTAPLTSREAVAFFARTFGLSDTPEEGVAEINRLIEGHYRADVLMKQGAESVLKRLQAAGWKMCVASATAPQLIDLCLRRLGVRDYFEFVLSCVEVGAGKNHPDVYLEAARRLGGTPEQTVVFEDAVFAVRTAKQAGFQVAAVYGDPNTTQDQAELKAAAHWYLPQWEDEDFLRQLGV